MQLTDTLTPVGVLTIEAEFTTGGRVTLFSQKNLITTPAKNALLGFLYQGGLASDPINVLQIGTGGTIDSQGFYPKQENPSQTSLNSPLLSLSTTYTVNSSSNSVSFLTTADVNTANGSAISEAGLFKASGGMFNVKNFPAIYKSSYFALYFNWTISFP